MHHAYSDTPKDPHSPTNYTNVATMMLATKKKYDDFAYHRVEPRGALRRGVPRVAARRPARPVVGRRASPGRGAYSLFYLKFAIGTPWLFLLLPVHFVMGPIHGAIVNWCGHKYGYKNFDNGDESRNTLVFDFLTAGELFQNNHHKFGMSPNFAARWFELDPAYQVMRVFAAVGIIDMDGAQRMRWPAEPRVPVEAPPAAAE